MSREIYLVLDQDEAIARCSKANVGVSAIEQLPGGGVRLVCMSGDGAERMRRKLKAHVIKGPVIRSDYRPHQEFRW